MMFPKNVMIASLLFICSMMQAQNLAEQLREELKDKNTLIEVMSVVDSFYTTLDKDLYDNGGQGLLKYKHWKRWEWYMERRLGSNGEFMHIPRHNLEAVRKQGTAEAPSTRSTFQEPWICLGMTESSYSQHDTNSYGNGTGRVDRIAFHPTDSNIIYIGAPAGGLWRTTDGGQNWEPLTDELPSVGVSGIVVTPSNPNKIYILTGVGDDGIGSWYFYMGVAPSLGVMVSEDAGSTWSFTGDFPAGGNFSSYDLVQNPVNEEILLAATSDGIFRTENGGTSWTKVKSGIHYDLIFKPGSDSVVYAASNKTIFYSTDTGNTWTVATYDIPPYSFTTRIALGVTPADPNIVYAYCGNNYVPSFYFSGIFLSMNSGQHFTRQTNAPNILGYSLNGMDYGSQANYDLCMAVHPDSAHLVSLGAINIWRSVDSCKTVSNNTGWYENQGALQYVHCDQHAMAYNPLDNKLYFCNDGGIWVTSDFGDSCTNISKGLVLGQFYHLSQDNDLGYRMAGGAQDNGVKYRAAGSQNFVHMFGADGHSTAFVPGNPNQFYSSLNGLVRRFEYPSGEDYDISPNYIFFKTVLTNPADSNLVFCGSDVIFRSTNKGETWTNVGGKGSWAMAYAPSDPARMYAAGGTHHWIEQNGGAVYTSIDTGKTWQVVSVNSGFSFENTKLVTDLAVDPNDPLTAYITFGGLYPNSQIYRTTNGGQWWTDISYNLPDVATLSVIASPDDVFVGTDISVYHLHKNDTVWTDIGSNIPHAGITDLLYDHNSGTLTAATFGRGIWQRNVCVEDITLTIPLEGSLMYSCDDQLQSSSYIPGNEIDSVGFRANGDIKLKPGFNVRTGAHFSAKINACEQGNIPLQQLPAIPEFTTTTSIKSGKE